MKKIICLCLAAALSALVFAACGTPSSLSAAVPTAPASSAPEASVPSAAAPAQLRIASLKGPTTMGMVKLMQDAEDGLAQNDYTFTMTGTADEIVPQLVKGDVDIALVPANLAAVLYQKTNGGVQVAAVNTLGVLYLLENGDTIHSIADLEGKTIYTPGKGTTPEYVLRYVLEQNGVTCNIEFLSEATEAAAKFEAMENCIVMLPQPYATAVTVKDSSVRAALDMTQEWDKVSDTPLITGVAVARKAFIEENPAAFEMFLTEYAASTQWVTANTEDAAALVAKYGIVEKEPIAKKALPACNITCLTGMEMKTAVEGYLSVLFKAEPKSVGGSLPEADFYYGA